MSAGPHAAVLGAGGTIAGAIVRDLAESPEIAGLRLLDIDVDRARAVAETHGAGRADARRVDASDPDALAEALAGCAVLVNSASYRINLQAMDAALAAGCHYLDLGGLYWMTDRQLDLHERFRQAGLLAVLGIGSSPGKTNVMAVAAAHALGVETLDAVHVSAAGRDPGAGPDVLRPPYAIQTLVDELTMSPVLVREGEPVEVEPMLPGGKVAFPEPIGSAPTIHTLHSELRTFPESFGCREASFRLSLAAPLLEWLRPLVGADEGQVRAAAAAALPPSDRTVSAHVVEAVAGERRAVVSALTVPAERWGLGGGVVSTAAPAAATARLLARGRIAATGALPPERCIDPDDLFPELEQRGCTFSVDVDGEGARRPEALFRTA